VMTPIDVQHIQLPNLPTKTLQELASLLSRTSTGKKVSRSFMAEFDDIPETISPMFDHLMHDSELDLDEGEGCPPRAHRSGYGKQWITSEAAFKLVLGVLWDEIMQPVIEILHLRVCASNSTCRPVTHYSM